MKKAFIGLLVVLLLSMGGAAHAAIGGHGGVISDVIIQVLENVPAGPVADILEAHPWLISSRSPSVEELANFVNDMKRYNIDEALVFSFLELITTSDATVLGVIGFIFDYFTTSSASTGEAVTVQKSASDAFKNFVLLLQNIDGETVTKFDYVSSKGELTHGKFTLVDANGNSVATAAVGETYFLAFHAKDGEAYDLNPAAGALKVAPMLARKTSGGGDSGGGGCNAGLAGVAALALLAGTVFLKKR